MHSAFASNLAILGPAGKRIEKTIVWGNGIGQLTGLCDVDDGQNMIDEDGIAVLATRDGEPVAMIRLDVSDGLVRAIHSVLLPA